MPDTQAPAPRTLINWSEWASQQFRLGLPHLQPPPGVESFDAWFERSGGTPLERAAVAPQPYTTSWSDWVRQQAAAGLPSHGRVRRPPGVESFEHYWVRGGGSLQSLRDAIQPLPPRTTIEDYLRAKGLNPDAPLDEHGRFPSLARTSPEPPAQAAAPPSSGPTSGPSTPPSSGAPPASQPSGPPAASASGSPTAASASSTGNGTPSSFVRITTMVGSLARRLGAIGQGVRNGVPVFGAISTVIHAIREGADEYRAERPDAVQRLSRSKAPQA